MLNFLYNYVKRISMGREAGDPSLSTAFRQDIRPLIDAIDNLRRFDLQKDIDLPNIVVLGDQSSGKSSVIEAISGIQLPRGKGMVTRCPLELQLVRVTGIPWKATLSYRPNRGPQTYLTMTEPREIEDNIQQAQINVCGLNKSVSRNLITLRIESPSENAPDLTLIDLPGIIRTPLADQPADICQQIQEIIYEHVSNPKTIILCIVSANLDAAVNESVSISKRYDPQGYRTLGVITKPDLTEDTDKDEVLRILNNQKLYLAKGFHMVKCRSQKELSNRISLDVSIANEKAYFLSDRYYRRADPSKLGTLNLSRKITKELVTFIRGQLPTLKQEINQNLNDSYKQIKTLPPEIPENGYQKLIYLNLIINCMLAEMAPKFQISTGNSIQQTLFTTSRPLFKKMEVQFQEIKKSGMSKDFTFEKLRNEIQQKRGREISGFLNFNLFENIITNHIKKYKIPTKYFPENIAEIVKKEITKIISQYFQHLPIIEEDLKNICNQELEVSIDRAYKKIDFIFERESIIFSMDEVFEEKLISTQRTTHVNQAHQQNLCSPHYMDGTSVRSTKELINIFDCYLKIVICRLSDSVTMAVSQCILFQLWQNLKSKLNNYIYEDNIETKIIEKEDIGKNRNELKQKIQRLQFASIQLAQI